MKVTPNLYEPVTFDKAISLTGYGKFHYETMALCAMSILAVGFQNGLTAYVFPAAQCELNLTSFELGALNIVFLLGGITSSVLWGILADLSGRRKILGITHICNALVTLLCVFISYKESLIVCRFFNGFFIGAPGAIIFSYLAEFQPPRYRSASVCCCGLFFTSSWLLLPILAHLVLPLNIKYQIGCFFAITPWRVYMALMVIPEAIVALWLIRLPESPKFYMAAGDTQKAVTVLKSMYSMNTGKSSDMFPVKCLEGIFFRENEKFSTSDILIMMIKQSKILFKPPLLMVTILSSTLMLCNMFGVYGLGLWIPELFLRFNRYHNIYPNGTITVKELAALPQVENLSCKSFFDPAVIQSTVAMAASSLLYNIISSYLSVKFPAKVISTVSMTLGGLSASSIYWLKSSSQNLALACVFQATMITANMTIGSISVDLFPTKISGIALCLIMCAGRMGAVFSNIIFGFLMDKHCEIPIFTVAAVVLLGAILCVSIPTKTNIEPNSRNDYHDRKTVEISVIS